MNTTAEERARDLQRRLRAIEGMAGDADATQIIAGVIRQAERESIEQAARLADPPFLHRKGSLGLWRIRRIEIAERIRNLKPPA